DPPRIAWHESRRLECEVGHRRAIKAACFSWAKCSGSVYQLLTGSTRAPEPGVRRQAALKWSTLLPIQTAPLRNSMLNRRRTTPQDYREWTGFGRQREREWVTDGNGSRDQSGGPTHAHLPHRQSRNYAVPRGGGDSG